MTILVTGANGMIGTQLVNSLLDNGYYVVGVDRTKKKEMTNHYHYYQIDLAQKEKIKELFQGKRIDRIIHLAALAHTFGEKDLSWERYYHVNVECARNLFECAGSIPLLYISTVDVYGFFDGKRLVTADTPTAPVTNYGKSKVQAEAECKKLTNFDIYRFSPVYTDSIKRDIQKRYYLKYPNIAYKIGEGSSYEILSIKNAVQAMVSWCSKKPQNSIYIIKDSEPMWTPDYISAERAAGKAKIIIKFPYWVVKSGYSILKGITGRNKYTYLLNKAVYPLKTE